jgi:hypothetical protein
MSPLSAFYSCDCSNGFELLAKEPRALYNRSQLRWRMFATTSADAFTERH